MIWQTNVIVIKTASRVLWACTSLIFHVQIVNEIWGISPFHSTVCLYKIKSFDLSKQFPTSAGSPMARASLDFLKKKKKDFHPSFLFSIRASNFNIFCQISADIIKIRSLDENRSSESSLQRRPINIACIDISFLELLIRYSQLWLVVFQFFVL